MSGLHDAFDEIVADVPVYGDLDRAIEQADRERLRQHGVAAGLVAAAAVVAVIVGVLAVTHDDSAAPQPTKPSPTPTETKSQSPQTWADTAIDATRDGKGWQVPDPLTAARDAWLPVVVEHLGQKAQHLEPLQGVEWGGQFKLPAEGSEYDASTAAASAYSTFVRMGLMVDRGDLNLLDEGCGYLRAVYKKPPDPDAIGSDALDEVSCTTKRFAGPEGERARISSWGRRCGAYEGDGPAPATCGDYAVGVAVERRDGLIGYILVDGRGTPDFNPFTPDAMAAAVADPRISLPKRAFAVPSDQVVASVVEDHFPGYRANQLPYALEHPGYAQTSGGLGRPGLRVTVRPAGKAPECARSWLIECVERRVFGADDPTTVFVGAWDEEDWADCCPKNSRADTREFVYVGPRHTVVVTEFMIVKADEDPISADLDQRLIDLVLDPRLQ
jgi:hypothetical protein